MIVGGLTSKIVPSFFMDGGRKVTTDISVCCCYPSLKNGHVYYNEINGEVILQLNF